MVCQISNSETKTRVEFSSKNLRFSTNGIALNETNLAEIERR